MRRSIILAGAACLAVMQSAPAYSQGAPQTVTLMKVDPQTLATGYRTSKVVGSTVVNEANDTVGTIRSDCNSGRADTLCRAVGGRVPWFRHEVRSCAFHGAEGRRQENGSSRRHEGRPESPPRLQVQYLTHQPRDGVRKL